MAQPTFSQWPSPAHQRHATGDFGPVCSLFLALATSVLASVFVREQCEQYGSGADPATLGLLKSEFVVQYTLLHHQFWASLPPE